MLGLYANAGLAKCSGCQIEESAAACEDLDVVVGRVPWSPR